MELYPICDESLVLSPNIWYSMSGKGESPFMRVGHTIIHSKSEKKEPTERGSLLIIGGANPSECFKDAYILDLKTLSWDKFEDANAFKTGRYEHACFQSNDEKIYIFGGADQEQNFNDIIRFDRENKVCEQISLENTSNGPAPRTIHCGVTFKDQLVVFGGGESGKTAVNDSKIYILNPISKKWIGLVIKGPSPATRHGHVMMNLNDKFIYLHGGMSGDTIYDDLWILDLSKMSWTKIESKKEVAPVARAAHGGIAIGKYLYIFGGLHKEDALDDLWKYDTESNRWSQVEIFGYKPPGRLDFAYCKLSFLNSETVREEVSTQKEPSTSSASDHELLLSNKIQELDLLMGTEDKKPLIDRIIPEKDENPMVDEEPKLTEEMVNNSDKVEENKSPDSKRETRLFNYLVIHGGMDTEGNVFDDCFLIHLD